MVFGDYAAFYDSLYQERDYLGESAFVKRLLDKHGGKKVMTLLDVGCGTGSHAFIFSGMGYKVTGIDRSDEMLAIAREKALELGKKIKFRTGDARTLDIPGKFDAAVALFAVLSYMVTNEDTDGAVRSVRHRLKLGGLFVFDVWFGPTVLTERPADRVKTINISDRRIIRIARPTLDIMNHTVCVNYSILELIGNKLVREVEESHLVRFFFYQEPLSFLERNGFALLESCPYLNDGAKIDEHSWSISVIAKAV